MKNRALVRNVLNHIRFLKARQKTRQQLLKLDNAALKDIGISHEEAVEEGSKPFWKPRFNDQEVSRYSSEGYAKLIGVALAIRQSLNTSQRKSS